MTDAADNRVAVYIDFDNIVISRYNQLHGTRKFTTDGARNFNAKSPDPIGTRVAEATVDIGAVLDFASSFGSVAISRAYADWSAKVNAGYREQLIDRAVDLSQLFTTTQAMKNGADIRLAVDVVEDLFRQADLTHVIIVAGDSDYIALAQRCKRLGRYVVGIGVAGSTSKALAAACDEFADYDSLPGISDAAESAASETITSATATGETETSATETSATATTETAPTEDASSPPASAPKRTRRVSVQPAAIPAESAIPADDPDAVPGDAADPDTVAPTRLSAKAATGLLVRALRLGLAKDDSEWMQSSEVKKQMRRINPTFNESALGYASFTDFVKSRNGLAEIDDGGPNGSRRIRLRPSASSVT